MGTNLNLDLRLGSGGGLRKKAIFTFKSTGTGADTGTLSLFYPASENNKVVKATGNVKLGAGGNLTEQVISGGATNTFTVTCLSGTGTLVLPNTYTRFSANTNDISPTNGWATSTNSPSLAFDIATLPIGLITFMCFGLNTVSGNLPANWKLMTVFSCTGSNTVSGNLPADWESMKYFLCFGSNKVSGDLPKDWKSMTTFRCEGLNKVSGDLPKDWKSMAWFTCEGLNTVSGNLPANWKLMTVFSCTGSNTVSGNLPADWKSMTIFKCEGSNTIDDITEGEYAGNGSMVYLRLNSNNNLGGLSTEEQEFLLKGKATRTWTGNTFNLASPATAMESMADTQIPGRWFSAAGVPTDVAVALKRLAIEKNVTVSLKGLTMPGTSGDGGGFPDGFGDWWRLP